MPIEHELMSVSPAQDDTPACQARNVLRHALHDAAVLEHHIMRRHFAHGSGEAGERGFAVCMPV